MAGCGLELQCSRPSLKPECGSARDPERNVRLGHRAGVSAPPRARQHSASGPGAHVAVLSSHCTASCRGGLEREDPQSTWAQCRVVDSTLNVLMTEKPHLGAHQPW